MSDAPVLQWDLGLTSTALSSGFLQLIKAASEDNIQPQAALALQALGGILQPSQELIGKAVNALNGVSNIKLEALKLTIGISSGGTSLIFRSSTPGITCFLLICALKLSYVESDVGQILYQMAGRVGVLNQWPASQQQLSQVVSALTGHACAMLPTQRLYDVGSLLLRQASRRTFQCDIYRRLSTDDLAKVLTDVFLGLRDEEIDKITLQGLTSSAWIVTILTWLIPNNVVVYCSGDIVHGDPTAKLRLYVKELDSGIDAWELTEWKKETKITSLIALKPDSMTQISLPRPSVKQLVQNRYMLSPTETALLGQIAGATHCMIVSRGRIYHRKASGRSGTATPISYVATDWFSENYESIMHQYGWTRNELAGQSKIYERLREWQVPRANEGNDWAEITERIVNRLYAEIEEIQTGEDNRITKECVEYMLNIALDALVFLSWQGRSDSQLTFSAPLGPFRDYSRILGWIMEDDKGMLVSHFRQLILETLFPHYEKLKGDELIMEGNGLVAWPSILAEPSCERKAAFALNLTPGHIKRDNERYSLVRETEVKDFDYKEFTSLGPVTPFEKGKFVGIPPRGDPLQFELHTFSSVRDVVVSLKFSMKFRGIPQNTRGKLIANVVGGATAGSSSSESTFSWLRAIDNLASAAHLDDNDMLTMEAEQSLARRIWLDSRTAPSSLPLAISANSDHDIPDDDNRTMRCRKFIARTCGDLMSCLYQLSLPNLFPIVRHNASIIKAVATANRLAESWVIIT